MAVKKLDDFLSNDRSKVRSVTVPKYDDYSPSGGKSTGSYGHQCYRSHPPLQLPGTELVIYGGSCSSPAVLDADVYIGFDHSMRFTERAYPWKKGSEFLFPIPDMGVPSKVEEFVKLVNWAKVQLDKGLKVHAGCIGGHGRTGTFLAAMVSLYGEKNAIEYVRAHYCKKAVESKAQVQMLVDRFGIFDASPHKSFSSTKDPLQTSSTSIPAVDSATCIWGSAKKARN